MGVSVCFGGRGEGERMKLAACVNISVNIWLCSWSQYDICVRCVCVGVCLCVLASHYHVKRADTSSALVVCMQSTKTINALTKFLHKKTATELQLQQAEYLKKILLFPFSKTMSFRPFNKTNCKLKTTSKGCFHQLFSLPLQMLLTQATHAY